MENEELMIQYIQREYKIYAGILRIGIGSGHSICPLPQNPLTAQNTGDLFIAELCITKCRQGVNKRFVVQCRELH